MTARIKKQPKTEPVRTLIPAAGYIRMSTRRQEDSPERQRQEIKALATRLGYSVVVWYEDHGKTGTESSKRVHFQQMLRDAATKGRRFDAILVHEQSRFSRERIVDVFQHWKAIDSAGVVLVTTARGVLDFNDTASVLSSVIDAMSARDESAKIAERCVGGLRLAVQRGQRLGRVPFAFDRVIVDPNGKEVMRATFREYQAKPRGGFLSKFVPSRETAAVELVKQMFKELIAGATVRGIVMRLNKQPVRPSSGKKWLVCTVHTILRNPAYCGTYRRGRLARGKFALVSPGEEVIEGMHEGIVSVATFERVQQILKAKHKPRGAAVEGRNLLVGTGRCAHCGASLHVKLHSHGARSRLHCSALSSVGAKDYCCYPSVIQAELETAVMRVVAEVLSGNTAALAKAQARKSKRPDDPLAASRTQLANLRAKIKKAAGNVALADDAETVRAINGMIVEWRQEAEQLEGKLQQETDRQLAIPAATKSLTKMLERFKSLPENLHKLSGQDRAHLAANLRLTLKAVRLGRKEFEGRWPRLFAEVEFLPGVLPDGCDPVIRLEHEDIRPPRTYTPALNLVLQSYPRTVPMADLMTLEPLAYIEYHRRYYGIQEEMARAVDWGWVEKTGSTYRAKARRTIPA